MHRAFIKQFFTTFELKSSIDRDTHLNGDQQGHGQRCQFFHKRLADKISDKRNKKYHEVMTIIITKFCFELKKSSTY